MPAQPPNRSPRHTARSAAVLVALVAVAAISTTIALASSSPRLKTAANAALGETIVVSPNGVTVYALSPETAHHLLCTSSTCLAVWPPVTVPSKSTKLTAAKGVKGKLGVIKRANGKFQLTLGGSPLYRFAPDNNKKGATNGNGINSFGGHWHVIKASGGAAGNAPANNPNNNPGYMAPGY